MDYEEYIEALCCDTHWEKVNGLRIEISKLLSKEFDLECEVERLREALDWVRREETRKEADYIWEGVDEILAGDPRWKEMIE